MLEKTLKTYGKHFVQIFDTYILHGNLMKFSYLDSQSGFLNFLSGVVDSLTSCPDHSVWLAKQSAFLSTLNVWVFKQSIKDVLDSLCNYVEKLSSCLGILSGFRLSIFLDYLNV